MFSVTHEAAVVHPGVPSPLKPLPVMVTLMLSPAYQLLGSTEVMVGGVAHVTWPWQSDAETMKTDDNCEKSGEKLSSSQRQISHLGCPFEIFEVHTIFSVA